MLSSSRQRRAPWFFLAPGLIIFFILVVLPIIQSLWLGFFKWDGLGDSTFIGLKNFKDILDDHQFYTSFKNSAWWMLFYLLSLPLGLALALFLNQKIFGMRLVKSLFFFPFVISQVVVGLVFSWFYDPAFGLLNVILNHLGFEPLAILSNVKYVTFGIIIAGLWPQVAYCMILYLAGLTTINSEQIEAGRLDGAKSWKMFFYVVLPQLRATSFIALVVTMIGALRSFDLVAIMTAGGPYGQSSVLGFYMYEEAVFKYRMGYGAAIATILFLIMSVFIAFFLRKMVKSQ